MYKRLAQCIRQYKKATLLTPTFVILEVVLDVIIPLLMATLIDKGIDAGNMNYILAVGGLLLATTLGALALGAASGHYAAIASAGLARNLRQDMFYNVQNFSFNNIDKFSTASIVTRLTTDVTNVQMAFQMMLRMAVRSPVMLVFSLIMAFVVNPELALIFLGVMPVLGIGLFTIIKKAHPIFERVFKTYDKLNNVVQEDLRGIRVVKSYVREDYEVKRFKDVSQNIYQDFSTADKLVAFNSPLMQLSTYTCMLLVSWFGARLIVAGSMTTGQLMSLISYAMQILMSLMMLSFAFVMFTISQASAERIVEILNEEPDLTDGDLPILSVPDGSIEFNDVDFSYVKDRDKLCLQSISVHIDSGETVGIIGGTGSGKTTLVQLIPRLYDVTDGSVQVGGIDVRNYDIAALRDAVAVVLQKNVLFSGTIKDNLRWGNHEASDEELYEACRLAQADEFIRSFPDGYDTYVEQGGTNLSGGQKQRLCIARALLKKPKILILDDSTSAVDTRTDALIRQAFRESLPEMTKLIIAQRINSVEDADKIIIMDGGRIHAVGTHEELLAQDAMYQEIYASQMKGGDFDEAV